MDTALGICVAPTRDLTVWVYELGGVPVAFTVGEASRGIPRVNARSEHRLCCRSRFGIRRFRWRRWVQSRALCVGEFLSAVAQPHGEGRPSAGPSSGAHRWRRRLRPRVHGIRQPGVRCSARPAHRRFLLPDRDAAPPPDECSADAVRTAWGCVMVATMMLTRPAQRSGASICQ